MRHNAHRQARFDELLRVIPLVRAQRDGGFRIRQGLPGIVNHDFHRFSLGVAVCSGHHGAGNQAVTVIAQRMTHEAQLAGRPAFAVQPGVGIGHGLMHLVRARLPLETAASLVAVAAVLAHKAFVARPGLDKGAIHAEVLARKPAVLAGALQHMVEQFNHCIMLKQALAVFREYRYLHRINHGQADEPAVQHVVLDLLHELAFRTNAVEHLQKHGAQQFLGRDVGQPVPDARLVHSGKQRIHFHQCLVDHLAYRAQRMVARDKVLQAMQRQRAFGEGVSSAHELAGFVSGQKKGCLRLSI